MKKGKKEPEPRWPVVWQGRDRRAGPVTPAGKIARLPRGVRDELNRRLQRGGSGAALLPWLNGLPETKAALARALGARKITQRDLAQWKTAGFCSWLARHEAEIRVVEQFQAWVRKPETHERLFGPPMTEFTLRNRIRQQFGRELFTREDIPPGENWDIPLTNRKERMRCFARIVGVSMPGADDENTDPPI